MLAALPARNIGPTQQGGRIVDLDADPRSGKTLYAAFASGGVWKTTNNGMSFAPIFDDQGTMGIGDIAGIGCQDRRHRCPVIGIARRADLTESSALDSYPTGQIGPANFGVDQTDPQVSGYAARRDCLG